MSGTSATCYTATEAGVRSAVVVKRGKEFAITFCTNGADIVVITHLPTGMAVTKPEYLAELTHRKLAELEKVEPWDLRTFDERKPAIRAALARAGLKGVRA